MPHHFHQFTEAQADDLRSLKQLIVENPFPSRYRWVEGHAKEKKGLPWGSRKSQRPLTLPRVKKEFALLAANTLGNAIDVSAAVAEDFIKVLRLVMIFKLV